MSLVSTGSMSGIGSSAHFFVDVGTLDRASPARPATLGSQSTHKKKIQGPSYKIDLHTVLYLSLSLSLLHILVLLSVDPPSPKRK